MLNLNKEMMEKVKTPEDLVALAKEYELDMTLEQAQDIFKKLNSKAGEISDEELDNVSGGNSSYTEIRETPESITGDLMAYLYTLDL